MINQVKSKIFYSNIEDHNIVCINQKHQQSSKEKATQKGESR